MGEQEGKDGEIVEMAKKLRGGGDFFGYLSSYRNFVAKFGNYTVAKTVLYLRATYSTAPDGRIFPA